MTFCQENAILRTRSLWILTATRLALLGVLITGVYWPNGLAAQPAAPVRQFGPTTPNEVEDKAANIRPHNNRASLRAAVQDIIKTFGEDYPRGEEFLSRLDKLKDDNSDAFRALQKEALVANPLVSGQPILFVARQQYKMDHHNTATMFQTGEPNCRSYTGRGSLKVIDFAQGGNVRTLLDPGPTATARDPEVSFDGKKIVFSMRRDIKDNYHIHEINSDGSGLKQLTSAPGVFDIDPLYLQDGGIVFTSSREPKYCMCNIHIMGNLFKMEGDGANIHQIGKSTLHEGHGTLMPDGSILYDRWEYVDRNFGDAQGLWTVNPDGTNHAIYFGNNTASPGAVIDARAIPGTELVLCIFSSCHDRPWGSLAIIDRRRGIDGREAVVKTWPAHAIDSVKQHGDGTYDVINGVRPTARAPFDANVGIKPKYEDPYPLSAKHFLVSRMIGGGEQMGIYLVDTFGNEILLHTEEPGCFDPMPLAPRSRPPISSVKRDFENKTGTFYVQNAHVGTYMKGVERGAIKYLRVVESPEKRFWTGAEWAGAGAQRPAMNWHGMENKRILGTVPVEQDGSAHFEVPADKFVYFQILDKDGMMIHSMRSGTIIQSGEIQGCIGCHEDRVKDVPRPTASLALKRPASKMNGWYGKPRVFSYLAEVQPVFDEHCVKCHDFGKEAGKNLILAGDQTHTFNASYIDLWSRGYIKCIGGGRAQIQQAYSWGSHPSKLTKILREGHDKIKGHEEVKLSKEEMDRINTWIDINAPYYPSYASAYPDGLGGRSPGGHVRLQELTSVPYVKGHGANQRAQVSFQRPELSPCLQKLDKTSAQYKEALAIIVHGKERLAKLPRADMPGFVPESKDIQRQKEYEKRHLMELRNREAIRSGTKVYDEEVSE